MTTDTLGEVWDYSLELCRELEGHGVQVHLLSMGNWPDDSQEKEVSRLDNVVFYRSSYKLEWMDRPWEDVAKAKKWLAAIYHTIRPDLVHFNNFTHLEHPGECPIITVYHSCVLSWWKSLRVSPTPAIWYAYRQWVANALNASDVIVSPSNSMLEQLERIHPIESQTRVIHSGRNTVGAGPVKKEPLILCSGRIWDQGVDLRYLSHLADTLPWPIYVAGEFNGPTTNGEARSEKLTLLGKIPSHELSLWMQRASIYLCPSKYEPYGLAVLEAAKAGCALALANTGSLREHWGNTALYFDFGNVGEMEGCLRALIADGPYRESIARMSQERSRSNNGRTMAEQYVKLYRRLLGQGKPKAQPIIQAL